MTKTNVEKLKDVLNVTIGYLESINLTKTAPAITTLKGALKLADKILEDDNEVTGKN